MTKFETTSPKMEEQTLELIRKTLVEVAARLDLPVESGLLSQSLEDSKSSFSVENADASDYLVMKSAQGTGIRMASVDLEGPEIWELVREGFTVVGIDFHSLSPCSWVFSDVFFGKMESTRVPAGRDAMTTESITRRKLIQQVNANKQVHYFVAEPSLTCEEASSSTPSVDHESPGKDHGHHEHMAPLTRILQLLRIEKNDVWSLIIFGFVVSVLDLATPLAIEQMVTTIGFASMSQPLIWLAVMLFGVLSLSAVIKGLQFFIIEILQRRIFVRIVGDLSERFPRLDQDELDGVYGPELANRFFDVMSMQKAVATLLVEGLFLVIQTSTGMVLLAVYSPFLLLYDVVLVFCMTLFLFLLGRNAVRTAIEESMVKYKVAHWLQDVIASPKAFQVHGAHDLVSDRANRYAVEYLSARRKHFIVLMRQTLFALMLYAIALTSILSLGLWLVLTDELTVGQLIASVSVIALVVGAFAKIGKSLESYYDLMAATDKVGHLLDLPTLPPSRSMHAGIGPVGVRVRDLTINQVDNSATLQLKEFKVEAGERYALVGGDVTAGLLMAALSGLRTPDHGLIEIGGVDSRDVSRFADGSMVGIASQPEIFQGSIQENVSLSRGSISSNDVRESLIKVGLWNDILRLSNGMDTVLLTGGSPLSPSQAARLMIARAIAGKPRLLLIDGALDLVSPEIRKRVWETLSDRKQKWTLIVATHDQTIIEQCDGKIELL